MRVLGILFLFFWLLACNNPPAAEHGLSMTDLKFPFIIRAEPYIAPFIPDLLLLPKSDNRWILKNSVSKLVCIWPKNFAFQRLTTDSFSYDASGNLFSEHTQNDLSGRSYRFEYDSLGFICRCDMSLRGDQVWEYNFDKNTRKLFQIKYYYSEHLKDGIPFLNQELYWYDELIGKYINKVPVEMCVYSFDTSGRLTELILFGGVEHYNRRVNYFEKYRFTYDSTKRIAYYSKRLWLRKGSDIEHELRSTPYPFTDSSFVQYYYHADALDSIKSSALSVRNPKINLTTMTYISDRGLPTLTKTEWEPKLIYHYTYITNDTILSK